MPHPSGLTYEQQITREISKAQKQHDMERVLYYAQRLQCSACVSFERFKASHAYAAWREKNAQTIAQREAEHRAPWTIGRVRRSTLG